ncbi:hypothetical protein [Bacillus atrophaeus]|uniref:hypothetical protein n=1 Tax=Bacillus atrophaeus TaxID=1452 RepID=UPI002DBD88D3|nr:hypothetical protein [Bacillus atrophaeus]MEC2310147.1 hypothetical protein [Bacillus atrophaeus]
MKRLLVSLKVWMVFLMNWAAPAERKMVSAAVNMIQGTYQRNAAVQAGEVSSLSDSAGALYDRETEKLQAAAGYKNRWLNAFKESPKRERAGPGIFTQRIKGGTIRS